MESIQANDGNKDKEYNELNEDRNNNIHFKSEDGDSDSKKSVDRLDSPGIRFSESTFSNEANKKTNNEYKVLSPERRSKEGERPRKRLSAKFNSFNYAESENVAFFQRHQKIDTRTVQRLALVRWLMSFLIGVYVAVIAICVTLCSRYLTGAKLAAVYALIKDCREPSCLVLPTFVWIILNMAIVFIGAYVVTFHAPLAAGSGIPNVKCYLNGIRMPGLMSLRTLLAKAGGVVLSVAGGLACGKEGPMIHSGAICASGLARVEVKCGKKRTWRPKSCDPLRTDEERRDFVASGAASGVSAAFGSPVGGVLFSLEEGASFLKQMLTWRMLFSSMTACLVLNVLLSAIYGHPEDMSHPGLVSFGHIGDISFRTFEIPIFILMGTFGGLTGSLFVHLNYRITLFRRRWMKNRWLKVVEAIFVAGCSAVVFVCLIYLVPDCQPIRGFHAPTNHTAPTDNHTNVTMTQSTHNDDVIRPNSSNIHQTTSAPTADYTNHTDTQEDIYGYREGHGYVFQGFCSYGEHNRMADVLFKAGEGGLHEMLHAPLDEWHVVPLLVLFIVYHLLATWTYGLSVSSGVFIPSLFIGAVWGRMVGILVMGYIPTAGTNIAKYALVGAAASLGGATRMTLSLTVIITECTGDITFGVPIMLALIVAKWTGDYFNPGIYDLHIEIQGIPLLPWEPPAMSYAIKAREVMTSPVECLRSRETVFALQSILNSPFSHNGYPVVSTEPSIVITQRRNSVTRMVDPDTSETEKIACFGRLMGFLRREDIEFILTTWNSEESVDQEVDLEPFIDRSPYSIQLDTSLPKIFKIFRGLGLRHLIVVNDSNEVVGIITRVNLARYRGEMHKGNFILEELVVAN